MSHKRRVVHTQRAVFSNGRPHARLNVYSTKAEMRARTIRIYCTLRKRRPPPRRRHAKSTSCQAWPTMIENTARTLYDHLTNLTKRSSCKVHFPATIPLKRIPTLIPLHRRIINQFPLFRPPCTASLGTVPKQYRVVYRRQMLFGPHMPVPPSPPIMIVRTRKSPYQGRERK